MQALNEPPPKDSFEFRRHLSETYFSLRSLAGSMRSQHWFPNTPSPRNLWSENPGARQLPEGRCLRCPMN